MRLAFQNNLYTRQRLALFVILGDTVSEDAYMRGLPEAVDEGLRRAKEVAGQRASFAVRYDYARNAIDPSHKIGSTRAVVRVPDDTFVRVVQTLTGQTAAELGAELGRTERSVRRWLQRRRVPRAIAVRLTGWCAALGVPVVPENAFHCDLSPEED